MISSRAATGDKSCFDGDHLRYRRKATMAKTRPDAAATLTIMPSSVARDYHPRGGRWQAQKRYARLGRRYAIYLVIHEILIIALTHHHQCAYIRGVDIRHHQ